MLSVTITEGEKKDLESKILELESQRSAVKKNRGAKNPSRGIRGTKPIIADSI